MRLCGDEKNMHPLHLRSIASSPSKKNSTRGSTTTTLCERNLPLRCLPLHAAHETDTTTTRLFLNFNENRSYPHQQLHSSTSPIANRGQQPRATTEGSSRSLAGSNRGKIGADADDETDGVETELYQIICDCFFEEDETGSP